MATNYNVNRTTGSVNGFGLKFCNTVYSATLKASTDTSIAVPSSSGMGAISATNNKFYAIISSTPADDVFVALNATAVVPAGSSFAVASSVLVHGGYAAWEVETGDVLHFISTSTASITVAFYSIQEG